MTGCSFNLMQEKLAARVHPDDKKQTCQRCDYFGQPIFSESGTHIKATCHQCGRYIKFVKQVSSTYVSDEDLEAFGKRLDASGYKGDTDSDDSGIPW